MKTCIKCVMDQSDPDIFFKNGICNHCLRYEKDLGIRTKSGVDGLKALEKIITKIKKLKGRYNCIIGVSGGVDSTYVAYLVKKIYKLNPLAIHIDNGWNSNLANENIENTLKILQIPLITHVLKWEEFKSLQVAFLKSSTPDGEIPTDHAINATLYNYAKKYNIKYVINGMNFKTESMHVDKWSYGHSDWKYIKSVNKIHGKKPLKTYPHFSLIDLFLIIVVYRIKVVSILNYIDFDKKKAIDILKRELYWKSYESKHYESVYTKFFQGYWLVNKFGIDKRKGHLSDLIRSKQLKREEAIKILKNKPISSINYKKELDFILKKLDINSVDFNLMMNNKNKNFRNYPNNHSFIMLLKNLYNKFRKRNIFSI